MPLRALSYACTGQRTSHAIAMMGDAYPPYRIEWMGGAPFSPRNGDSRDRYRRGDRDRDRDRGWDDQRRDRSMERNRDMMRQDRSRSRERGSARDRGLDWNRRLPKKPGPPPRLDTGNKSSGSSTPQPNAVTAPCESAFYRSHVPIANQCSTLKLPWSRTFQRYGVTFLSSFQNS